MDTANLEATAVARSVLYWLLADLFLNCPDETFIARLRRDLTPTSGDGGADPVVVELTALRQTLPADASETAELAVEYTRLFGAVSPTYGPPPPYESLHAAPGCEAETAAAIGRFYAAAGLAPVESGVPPDHLGNELRFLALLCHGESEAWRKSDTEAALGCLLQQRTFLQDHLCRWVPGYLETVLTDSSYPFFRSVAALTNRVMTEAGQMVETLVAEAGHG